MSLSRLFNSFFVEVSEESDLNFLESDPQLLQVCSFATLLIELSLAFMSVRRYLSFFFRFVNFEFESSDVILNLPLVKVSRSVEMLG